MQLLKKAPTFSKENKLRERLIKSLRPCVKFYLTFNTNEVDDLVKETYESLKEFLELLQSPREIMEWKQNAVSFYDVCDAYYKQAWLPFYKKYISGLIDEELSFHYSIIEVHHQADAYRSAYGYAK